MSEEKKKVLLVFNPFAASKRAKKLLKPLVEEFKKYNVEVKLRVTRFHNDAIGIVMEEDFSEIDAVVVAGGDGSIFEVINGIFRRKEKANIPLGIIPVGTGNAFARDIDLATGEWEKAVKIICEFKTRKVDVGYFETAGEDHYFMNILGVGFVADVTQTAYRMKWLGNISYTLGVSWQMFFLKQYNLTIVADGKEYKTKNTFVEISNTRYTSNFFMAPNALIDDGLLDITLLNGIGRLRLIKLFPKVFTGEHIHVKEVETIKARHIILKTDVPKVLTPDGELLGITPIEVKCLPKAVDVLCAQN